MKHIREGFDFSQAQIESEDVVFTGIIKQKIIIIANNNSGILPFEVIQGLYNIPVFKYYGSEFTDVSNDYKLQSTAMGKYTQSRKSINLQFM